MTLFFRILRRRNAGLVGIAVTAILMLVVYAAFFPGLLSFAGLAQFSVQWLPLALTALGQMMVMLVGGIDLAMGSMVSLGSVLAATLLGHGALGTLSGTVETLGLGAVMGLATGSVVVFVGLPAIIVTLATSFILSGIALLILPQPGGSVPSSLQSVYGSNLPVAFLGLVVVGLLWRAFASTEFGIRLLAFGDNPAGTMRSGVRTTLPRLTAYLLGGVLGSLAGYALALQTGSGDPTIGVPFTLNSITAAVLGGVALTGGVGTFRGVLAGSIVVTAMTNVLYFLGVPAFFQYVVQGAIILIALGLPKIRQN